VLLFALLCVAGCGAGSSGPQTAVTGQGPTTAQGQTTAQGPSPTSTPAVADSLTGASNQWTVLSPSCQFVQGGYQVTGTSTQGGVCVNTHLAPNQGTVSVTVTINSDSGKLAGMVLRFTGTNTYGCQDCYLFGMVSDGHWVFAEFALGASVVLASGQSSAVKTGLSQPNTLTATFQGSTFTFAINGTTVDQASNSTLKNAGRVGFLVAQGMQATYTNFAYYA
jgi:hypothetical protein